MTESATSDPLESLKKANSELHARIHALQNANLINQKKIEVLEGEVSNLIKDNHKLIVAVENETAQKLNYLQTAESVRNQLTLDGAEAHKFQAENKRLLEENERVKSELQGFKLQKVSLLKEKQNACNKLVVAQAKLEAITMENTFINATLAQTTADNQRLNQEIASLNKKLKQGSGSYVKTILKDSNQTKKDLLSEFQQKIHDKQLANHQEIQKYEAKIAQLNIRVAQLESQLASK